MAELTPTKIGAWLQCAHFLVMDRALVDGAISINSRAVGDFAQLVMEKGREHEHACLENFAGLGLDVLEVPRRGPDSFEAWLQRIGDPFDSAADVLYQVPLANDGMRGIADFLTRSVDEEGEVTWEPVDAKLARAEAKPGHVLQLCFYAEVIEAATGRAPENLHLWLGSGAVETIRAATVMPYWRRLRSQLQQAMEDLDEGTETVPVPCTYCDFCQFNGLCEERWRSEDALHYVAGINKRDTEQLSETGVDTLEALAEAAPPIDVLRPERAVVLTAQARLQLEARTHPASLPPVEFLPDGHGLSLLPEPDEGDIFLDFEGHPFWRPDRGLFFLFGYLALDEAGTWRYHPMWAYDIPGEAAITQQLVDLIAERRAAHPGMHVYHYNHTERSSLDRLAAEHGARERVLAELVETGCFVDLLDVVRHSLRAGVESYGLKYLEVIAGYERTHEIDRGSGAVVEFEQHRVDGDPARLGRIERYNEDDVRATLALRDWLIDMRPAELAWRPSFLEVEGLPEGFDEQVERLLAVGSPEAELLAHVLGYWLREFRAHRAPLSAKLPKPEHELLSDPVAITGLCFEGMAPPTGTQRHPAARFSIPEQELDPDIRGGSPVIFSTADGLPTYGTIRTIAPGELTLVWGEGFEGVEHPETVVFNDWVHAGVKVDALSELADDLIAGRPSDHAAVARTLLLRELPRIHPPGRPSGGLFTEKLEDAKGWARHLDCSVLSVQGPPGTGKTYRGSHIIKHLIDEGLRVGITATSYAAIDNLVMAVCDRFAEADDAGLRAVRTNRTRNPVLRARGVTFGDNARCASPDFNLVAGTSWLFAGQVMAENPVDVLVIDEAGQLSLADALAALRSAKALLLLGDPLQLPHVSQATHPQGSGASVLGHILGDDKTMPPERGIFLRESWRMHPDVCNFISEQIYEGRLTSEGSCASRGTELGTGLRWLSVEHAGNQTESVEEADRIADAIEDMIGMTWTDEKGLDHRLAPRNVMVVAPYNAQVGLIRRTLEGRTKTQGVPVGTVDKFQGQEAVVVFFSMTTSSYDDMPRGPEFLFSPNRLNVAISRAQCLAYLVSTEEILNSRARNVGDMAMISNLCAFVEDAVPV